METYKCVIIDDDEHAILGLKKYISDTPGLTLFNTYTDPLKALMDLSQQSLIDLILLDIEMPLITGIELSKSIRQKTQKLIFTTAHTRYGYEAFEAEADAYLLKPYSFVKFASTIAKIFPKPSVAIASLPKDDFFFVKNKDDNHKMVKVKYSEIVAVESKQNYIMIHTLSKKLLTYMSLTAISAILQSFENFAQFQRSFIICKNHIDHVYGNTLKMVNGLEITVGEYYKKDFAIFMSDKIIKAGRKINALP